MFLRPTSKKLNFAIVCRTEAQSDKRQDLLWGGKAYILDWR